VSSPPGPVWAVIIERADASTEAVQRAVAAQSVVPEQVVVAGSPAGAVRRALEVSAAWLWLLDARALPRPDALAELQRAAAGWPDERLVLLSSQLVDEGGSPLAAEAPLPQALDADLAAEAFEHRTYSMRVVGYGSLLIRTEALRAAPPPPGRIGADLVWSARLLTHGVGLLVPRSVARLSPTPRSRLMAGWARLLASHALATHEKPWAGYIYFNRTVELIAGSGQDRRPSAGRPKALSR
jgi:hypothetical protein